MATRQEAILEFLKLNKLGTVDDLVKATGASPATIRRDLVKMDEQGLVYRVHGSVTLNRFIQNQPTTNEKLHRHHHEKELIGVKAASLISDGNSIVLDAGTTTLEIAKNIVQKNIRVITSDLHIGILLADHQQLEVSVTGGIIDWSSQSCIGINAVEMMRKIHPTYTFVSCNAFDLKAGITAPTQEKANFKAELLKQSSKKVLVADSSKFGKTQLFEVAPLTAVDMIITDTGIGNAQADEITSMGIELVRCE